MSLQLIDKLHIHAKERPHAIALRQIIPDAGLTVTWSELLERTKTLAADLRQHVGAGGTVVLIGANQAFYTSAFLAILWADLTVFPVSGDIASAELNDALRASGAEALLKVGGNSTFGEFFAHARSLPAAGDRAVLFTTPREAQGAGDRAVSVPRVDLRRAGPALLLQSSGTTGQSKIVRRDGPALDAVSSAMVEAIGFTPADCVLAAVPLCHSYGMEHGLLCPVWSGCKVHLYDRFDIHAAVSDLQSGAVTVFPGVPFMFEMLSGGAAATGQRVALRRAYSAGGPLPRALFDEFRHRFGHPIAQLYGATEIGSVTFNDPAISPFNPASVGRAMNAVSIRILDPTQDVAAASLPSGAEGHVAIRAPSMLSHYLGGHATPLADGHFLTGDLGRLDSSGALTLTGRIKLLIDVAGRKVNPLEVEQVLVEHPRVGQCVVVPIRVSATLNRLKAIITAADPAHPPSAIELRHFARARLSSYKIPRIFELCAAIPRSPAGKILRQALQDENADERIS